MKTDVRWVAVLSFFCAVSAVTGNAQELPSSGGVRVRLVKGVRPDYPSAAVQDSLEGRVLLSFLVDEDGRPNDVKIQQSSEEVFNEPSMIAVRQFVFTPGSQKVGPCMIGFHFTPQLVTWETAPVLIWCVQPVYPELALRALLEGNVTLRIWVNKHGVPLEVKIQKSDSEVFDEPAITAGKQYLFMPAYKNGDPIDVYTTVPLWFHLVDRK